MRIALPPTSIVGHKAAEVRAKRGMEVFLEQHPWSVLRAACEDIWHRLGLYPEHAARWSSRDTGIVTCVLRDWERYDLPTRAAVVVLVHRLHCERASLDRTTEHALESAWRRATGQTSLFEEEP